MRTVAKAGGDARKGYRTGSYRSMEDRTVCSDPKSGTGKLVHSGDKPPTPEEGRHEGTSHTHSAVRCFAARYCRHAGALIPSLDVSPTSRRCSWDSAFFGFLYGSFWRSVAFFVRLCVRWKDGQRN
ncbi:unnamed protein product [Sphagnum jensenii]|uniref:Uncharacterized protein n=1 Tax=Sphagnum jensenii TaxID=128206 RepID=A0ABP1AZD4_9BRYO